MPVDEAVVPKIVTPRAARRDSSLLEATRLTSPRRRMAEKGGGLYVVGASSAVRGDHRAGEALLVRWVAHATCMPTLLGTVHGPYQPEKADAGVGVYFPHAHPEDAWSGNTSLAEHEHVW